MGSKTVNQTTTNQKQENAPPAWALPGLTDLAGRVTAAIPGVPGPKYEGDFIASPNATQYASLPLYAQAAQMASQAGGQALGAAGQMQSLTPNFGTAQLPTGNFSNYDARAIQPVVETAIQPIMRQLMEQVLPSMRSSALSAGAYGNDRANSILPAMAIRDAGRQAMEVGTGLAFNDYNMLQQRDQGNFAAMTERGLGEAGLRAQQLSQMPNMLDAAMRFSTGAGDIMSQSGNMQQGWDQSAIENQLARFNYNLNYPFQGLDTATNLMAALAGNYGTQTMTGTQKNVQSQGGLAPIIGGLVGLGSMVAGMPGGGAGIASLFGGGGGGVKVPPINHYVMGM